MSGIDVKVFSNSRQSSGGDASVCDRWAAVRRKVTSTMICFSSLLIFFFTHRDARPQRRPTTGRRERFSVGLNRDVAARNRTRLERRDRDPLRMARRWTCRNPDSRREGCWCDSVGRVNRRFEHWKRKEPTISSCHTGLMCSVSHRWPMFPALPWKKMSVSHASDRWDCLMRNPCKRSWSLVSMWIVSKGIW